MRQLTAPSRDLTADCWHPDALDAAGSEPDDGAEPLDILVMHAGALRRPWLRVRLDPATGAVLGVDVTPIR